MSFTGIGRIGSQHILNINVSQDVDNFFFPQGASPGWWCTHPLKYSVDILNGGTMTVDGTKIVTGSGCQFTNLCADIQMDNKPIYRYVAYFGDNNGNALILDIDYVIDDNTMVLKFPSTEFENNIKNAAPIDYFNTMILKEVTINNMTIDYSVPLILELGSKFGETIITLLGDRSHHVENEGGVEPLLITQTTDAPPILNY